MAVAYGVDRFAIEYITIATDRSTALRVSSSANKNGFDAAADCLRSGIVFSKAV